MYLLYALLILLALYLVIDFTRGFRIWISATIQDEQTKISFRYLYPLFAAQVAVIDERPYLAICLLNVRVYNSLITRKGKQRKRKPGRARKLLSSLQYDNLSVSSRYGFADPFSTGVLYGSIGSIAGLFHIQKLTVEPDFFAANNYVALRADATVSLGQTILRFIRNK